MSAWGGREVPGLDFETELAYPHDATADAVAAIEVLFAMATRYEELWNGDPARLRAEQAAWHHVWTQKLDARRQSRGLPSIDPPSIDPCDHVWPVAPAYPPAA